MVDLLFPQYYVPVAIVPFPTFDIIPLWIFPGGRCRLRLPVDPVTLHWLRCCSRILTIPRLIYTVYLLLLSRYVHYPRVDLRWWTFPYLRTLLALIYPRIRLRLPYIYRWTLLICCRPYGGCPRILWLLLPVYVGVGVGADFVDLFVTR